MDRPKIIQGGFKPLVVPASQSDLTALQIEVKELSTEMHTRLDAMLEVVKRLQSHYAENMNRLNKMFEKAAERQAEDGRTIRD